MPSDLQIALSIAATPALQERGCVQTIGLGEIRAQLAQRWDKRKETVWMHLEGLLRQKLSSTDYFTRLDETSFLVSMPTAQGDEAQIFCLRIAHDLHRSLLGLCESSKLRVAQVTAIQGETIATTPLEGPALALLAQRAGIQPAGEPVIHHQLDKPAIHVMPSIDFGHKFVPVWDAQREAVTTWRCTSTADSSALESLDLSHKQKLAIALSRIGDSARRLSRHLAAGERFILWLPLSYELLTSAVGRMEIAGACRSLTSDLRPYLMFEICDLPEGVPQSRLNELVCSLKPFCRGVAALLPAQSLNHSAYLGAGLQAIGLSLAGLAAANVSSEICRLSMAVRKQKMTSFLLNVPHEQTLQNARALGINLMSSQLIGPVMDDPRPIRRLRALSIAS